MEQKYSLKQIKAHLKAQPTIKFSGVEKPEEKNPVAFIKNFFKYNRERNTVSAGNGHTQTVAGSRRSIGDIFRVCHYYFPKLTMTTLYKTLLTMSAEGKVLSSICLQTGMRVYRATKDTEKAYFNGQHTDEFGIDLDKFEEIKQCKSSEPDWGYKYTAENLNFITIKK